MFWPFTVWGFLKPNFKLHEYWLSRTCCCNSTYRLRYWNDVFFIFYSRIIIRCNSTYRLRYWNTSEVTKCNRGIAYVATVLTACGIETWKITLWWYYVLHRSCNSTYRLRYWNYSIWHLFLFFLYSCNSTYRLRYWNLLDNLGVAVLEQRCNSTYRLRYWNS